MQAKFKNPEHKKMVVEEMRRTKKHRKKLKRTGGGGTCCLGDMCNVYKRLTGKGRWSRNEFITENDASDVELPLEVHDYFFSRSSELAVTYLGTRKFLVSLNDGAPDIGPKGIPKHKIADLIEEQM